MKVMVVGPMTGYDDFNFPKFARVEERLRVRGHEVTSMRKIVVEQMDGDTSRPSGEYMKVAIPELVQQDAVALIAGWEQSNNTRTEIGIALTAGMKFFNEYGETIPGPDSVVINRKK